VLIEQGGAQLGIGHASQPDGQVETLGNQVGMRRCGRQVQPQLRVQGTEFLQQRHHLGGRVFGRGGQAQRAAQLQLFAARLFDGLLGGGQHRHAVLVEALARLGQRQAAGVAHQQGHAQLLLQPFQVEAHHSLALAQALSGRGEAASIDHGLEGLETVQADHRARLWCQKWFDSLALDVLFIQPPPARMLPPRNWSAA